MYQKIRRAIAIPSYPAVPRRDAEETDWVSYFGEILRVMSENYTRLAREVIECHNQIQVYQLPVAGAAVLKIVPWLPPFFDANYSAFCTPDWLTTVSYGGKTNAQIQFNFGVAAPGGGGNILVLGIR